MVRSIFDTNGIPYVSIIFSEFQLCIVWGKGELQKNFEKDALFYEGTQKWQKIMNIALLSEGPLSMIVIIIIIQPRWSRLASATQVHELTAELEQLPRRAQVAAGFITYLSSAPEDVRKATMAKWCEAAGLQGFDFRRFMSTESEQLGWKAEGLPSDDLSMENALVILKVTLSVCNFNVQLSVFYLEISSSVSFFFLNYYSNILVNNA